MSNKFSARHYAVSAVGDVVVAGAFAYAILVYWSYFHIGNVGSAMFVAFIGLPVSLVLTLGLGVGLLHQARRRDILPMQAVVRSLGAVTLLFGLLFAAELWRTASDRGPESGGSMAGYVARLVGA